MRLLGDLEAIIMDHLWAADDALSVREVLAHIEREPPLAYNTVLTVMRKLHRKGLLVRERDGRAFRYRPTKERADHTVDLMHELLNSTADSSVTLIRFVHRMSPTEVERLKRALDD